MPIHWAIDPENQVFEVVCDGLVEASEIHQMIDPLVGAKALGYRKLFDGSQADTALGPLDVLSIGVRLRSLHAPGVALGPLAVVIPDNKSLLLSRVLGILAAGRRPMRIFNNSRKPGTGSPYRSEQVRGSTQRVIAGVVLRPKKSDAPITTYTGSRRQTSWPHTGSEVIYPRSWLIRKDQLRRFSARQSRAQSLWWLAAKEKSRPWAVRKSATSPVQSSD